MSSCMAPRGGPADHMVTVVGFTPNGQPLTVGQNGTVSPNNPKAGNVTLNSADTFENSGKQAKDWEAYSPNDGSEPPQNIKDKSTEAGKGQPPTTDAQKKAWLAVWLLCRERNYAMMGTDAAGKKESLKISRREVIQPPDAPQYVTAPPTPPDGGLYAGGEGGGRSTGGSHVTTTRTTTLGGDDAVLDSRSAFNSAGAVGGVYIGYSSPFSPNFVAQVEVGGGSGNTDTTHAGIPGTAGIPVAGIPARIPNDSTNVKTTWDLHVLGRLGVKVTPSTTLFVTGGGGWLHSETTVNCTTAGVCGGIGVPPFTATNSATRAGWILGGAVETTITRMWKARLEYRHGDYGTQTTVYGNPALLAVAASTRLTTDQVMFGVSYQFGAPPVSPRPAYSGPPMVTKAPALK